MRRGIPARPKKKCIGKKVKFIHKKVIQKWRQFPFSIPTLNSSVSTTILNVEENYLSRLGAFCETSLYISYLVTNSSHTKPCYYTFLDFVPSMLLFFCRQAGILLNRLLQSPTWPRFNCTVHKYCNLCTYINNANLNKRLAWTGRTTKDQVDEQFQNP